MALNKNQEELYKKTMDEAKAQLETIDDEMEKVIQNAREKLAGLQESKRSFKQLYEGASRLLGIKIIEEEQEEEPKEKIKEPEQPDTALEKEDEPKEEIA
jgi:hypothetical protein